MPEIKKGVVLTGAKQIAIEERPLKIKRKPSLFRPQLGPLLNLVAGKSRRKCQNRWVFGARQKPVRGPVFGRLAVQARRG